MDARPPDSRRIPDVSFVERKLRGLTLRRNLPEGSVDTIGDLGLNLLHEPAECLVDLVFVHGLRGGSRKTWSASPSIAHYWPKEWLPADPDFRHVRIHSFGYNSDWLDRRENLLDIHDFGQSLIEELQNSPQIRRDKNTRIVFIGHSMGGLVIKKACILAKENPSFHDLGLRIHSLYFLATPHRGSDLAQALNNMLKVLPTGSKPFLGSLERGSETINTLNDQFRHVCRGVAIHSFMESVPMNWGIGSGLVVEKHSATLGYPDERIQFMNADHRGICKFDTPKDPNYRTLRNRLASTVEDIERVAPKSRPLAYREEMQTLSTYLNVFRAPINDLSALGDDRVPGSCEWLTKSNVFLSWKSQGESARFCLLTGPPGTGKSVTTAHVVSCLADDTCSYFFFEHGDHKKSSLNGLLLSLAFQMAQKSYLVRKILLDLAQDDSFLDKNDFRGIWRQLFVDGIFRADFTSTQFWVLDAFDECVTIEKRSLDNFFVMLAKIEQNIPIKIFISSRSTVELERLFSTLPLIHVTISLEDSTRDIRRYVETYAEDLPAEDDESRRTLIETIVQKSAGCFLWTVLVMRELREVYTSEETEEILLEVPEEMDALYTRNLQIMESKPRTKRLAQAVIVWTLCATRSLSVDELKAAIRLDLNTMVVRDLERSISTLCSQFVFVDKHHKVHIVHETARSFLQNSELESEFRVSLPLGNVQLGLACFEYLTSDEMAPPKKRRGPVNTFREPEKNSLASYARVSFSEHLVRATSASDPLFLALTKFLRTNVLVWIERMAEGNNLDCLIQTAKHLKAYQAKRVKHMAPLQDEVSVWSTDIPRIATEFGVNLLKSPAAIHDFIPPLCPRASGIYRNFATAGSGLQLLGLSNVDWDDRISCWHYDKTARCIASQKQWFAIGLSDGTIDVHWASTCQEAIRMNHGESVRLLRFGALAKVLVSTGLRMVKLWDLSTGSKLWEYRLDSDAMSAEFDGDDTRLLLATRSKRLLIWSTADGTVLLDDKWHQNLPIDHRHIMSRAPSAIAISTSQKLMAIVYRMLPLCLWDLEFQSPLGFCTKRLEDGREGANIMSMCFNPVQVLNLIAVAYMDGDVVIFDTMSRIVKCQARIDTQILSVSPDGRTLAGGEADGTIKLFDFESLQPLYRVTLSDNSIAALAFTSDSLRLIDLRGAQANIWEPSALVRKWNYSDEESIEFSSEATAPMIQGIGRHPVDQVGRITALKVAYAGSMAICGKDNGAIDIYDLDSSAPVFHELYKHKGSSMSILSLDWNEARQMIASVDASSFVIAIRIRKNSHVFVQEQLLKVQLPYGHTANQILISPSGTRILISTFTADFLWSLETGKLIVSQETESRVATWRWITNPLNPSEILLLQSTSLESFSWEASETFLQLSETSITMGKYQPGDLENIVIDNFNNTIILRLFPLSEDAQRSQVSFRTLKAMSPHVLQLGTRSRPLMPIPIFRSLEAQEATRQCFILGTMCSTSQDNSLVFIAEGGWICSVDLNIASLHSSPLRKHFFIPAAWVNTSEKIIAVVTERKDILFVRGHEIAVIKGGLDTARADQNRPTCKIAL